ncbi:MAG: hypothetical protein KDE27_27785 [Planctomycetes bacterium]|nr:hypothetical protein [Planctomycetota bacterium]
MRLALVYLWKEWRAQRAILIAYTLLVFTCLSLGLSLAPTHYWFDEAFGVHALGWFVTAGVIGAVAFAAPGLVRAEFAVQHDRFVRRLPGALGPALGGKLLFLLLACALLPLLGLLVGEVFVTARGADWNGLFTWRWDGGVEFEPIKAFYATFALLLAPWVFAIGCWLPGGRMAIGGAVLFTLLVGVGVFAVLRQSPNLEKGIAWHGWLWAVAPLGVLVAAVSFARGRRGGGPLRSARLGLTTAGLGLLPPAVWFGAAAYDYHHPDPGALVEIDVQGLSPDGRFALVRGNAHQAYSDVTFRVDLTDGAALQVTGVDAVLSGDLGPPFLFSDWRGANRFWSCFGLDDRVHLFDLSTGELIEDVDYDPKSGRFALPPELAAAVVASRRQESLLRAPGDRPLWFEGDVLCRESADSSVVRVPLDLGERVAVRAAGHGFRVARASTPFAFDWRGRRWPIGDALFVGDVAVFARPRPGGRLEWCVREFDGTERVCSALAGRQVVGLCDDATLLVKRLVREGEGSHELALFTPADGALVELPMPPGVASREVDPLLPFHRVGSLLARDPRGRIWLSVGGRTERTILWLDPADRSLRRADLGVADLGRFQLLDWPDADSVLLSDRRSIVRIDTATRVRSVLFPRVR